MDALERLRTLGDLEPLRTGRCRDGHGHGTKTLTPLYQIKAMKHDSLFTNNFFKIVQYIFHAFFRVITRCLTYLKMTCVKINFIFDCCKITLLNLNQRNRALNKIFFFTQ